MGEEREKQLEGQREGLNRGEKEWKGKRARKLPLQKND